MPEENDPSTLKIVEVSIDAGIVFPLALGRQSMSGTESAWGSSPVIQLLVIVESHDPGAKCYWNRGVSLIHVRNFAASQL